jgi:glutathione synthase/RimK-type ligase-like ATP-grasp enzyme
MILIVTNTEDKTADYLLSNLANVGFRFNTDKFLCNYEYDFCQEWYILDKTNNSIVNSNNISGIYYRRPVLPYLNINDINNDLFGQLQNEAYEIYDSFINSIDTKYLNTKYNIIRAENKIIQMKMAKDIGFSVPATIITNNEILLNKYLHLSKKYCIKPLHLGYFELNDNKYIPYTAIIGEQDYNLITKYPVIVQEYIDKEYELRLTCVKDKIFPVKILSQLNENTKVDWRVDNCSSVNYLRTEIDSHIENMCLKLLSQLNLNFACIDLIINKDKNVYFLDLNPNGQWAWIDEILELGIPKAIEEYFYDR